MEIHASFRALCHSCGLRFAWQGTLFDMPPCPRCGQAMTDREKQLAQIQLENNARQNTLDRLTRSPQGGRLRLPAKQFPAC